MLKPSFQHGS
jgi:hypothetical protein